MVTLMDVFASGICLDAAGVRDIIQNYIDQGLLRANWHPTEPLALLNYTEKCTFDKAWDVVTLNCRGLIYNTQTLEVVARPFPKFFNHNESNAAKFSLTEKVFVTDKADGSLGILYREPTTGLAAIATRGSFTSEQARHATYLLHSKYAEWTAIYEQIEQNDIQVTLCFEIIYPSNRIVLNYGDTDDLVLLGGVQVADGDILNPYTARVVYGWRGPVTKTLGTMTFRQVLELEPRENAEGVVVRSVEGNRMVKIKQEDYVILHRLITGLTERTVWEAIMSGKSVEEIQEPLPEEFHPWVDEVATRLGNEVHDRFYQIQERLDRMFIRTLPQDRASFARMVIDDPDKWAMFLMHDGRKQEVWEKLWQQAKPEAVTPNG